MCFFIHKWGKWKEYDVFLPARRLTKKWVLCQAVEKRQRKVCEKCGKIKDEWIGTFVISNQKI